MMPTTYQQGYGGRGRARGHGRSRRTQQQYSPGGFPPNQGMGGVFPPTYAMPPPQEVAATCITMPLREAYQEMPLTAACNRMSGPLTPI